MDLVPALHAHALKKAGLIENLRLLFPEHEAHLESWVHLGAAYVNKKRVLHDTLVEQGDYIRFHPHPKRYPECRHINEALILEEGEDYLFVYKPKGVPVHATLDNATENLCATLCTLKKHPLYVTHRLDQISEGLMVMAKTPRFLAAFNHLLAHNKVEKKYHTFTSHSVERGQKVHYMEKSERAPKTLFEVPTPNTLACELHIESVETLSPWPQSPLFGVSIRLVTGRTHQIRAQLSKLGAPILGDKLYGSTHPEKLFRLVSKEIRFHHPFTKQDVFHRLVV